MELENELENLEKKIYELETWYLKESTTHGKHRNLNHLGNLIKGFEWSTNRSIQKLHHSKKETTLSDRLFSLSSYTSNAEEKMKNEARKLGLT